MNRACMRSIRFSRRGKAVIESRGSLSGPIRYPLNRAKNRVSMLKYISFTLYSFYNNYFPLFSILFVRNLKTSVSSGARIAVFSTDIGLGVPPRMQEYTGEITEVQTQPIARATLQSPSVLIEGAQRSRRQCTTIFALNKSILNFL